MSLEISAFINANPDWEKKLSESPYFVKTKRDGSFVLLKYSQFDSDFTLPIVRECRGIILDQSDNYKPVCVPFFKFGNFNENYVPQIDWESARVQEKRDGSLIKIWHYGNKWQVSSNGEIDARNALVNSALLTTSPHTDLFTLFMTAWNKHSVDMNRLDPECTYMFELTSPHNRIVVRYEDVEIHHIGTRDMRTLLERDEDIGIPKPRVFPLRTLDEC